MPNDIKIYFLSFVIALLLLGAFILLLAALYSQRQVKNREERQQMQNRFQQELLQTQIEIQEQTLKNLSQEIHDNIGQALSLAKLNLFTLKSTEEEKVQDTRQLVSKALSDLRDLSRSMHGDRIAEMGLQNSIETELSILRNSGQFKTSFSTSGKSYQFQPQTEIIIFRIFQESLNNAVKHSNASNIDIYICYEVAFYRLIISDDGKGFASEELQLSQRGIGLKSMQNRASLISGNFTIQSAPGNGTIATLEVNR